MTPSPKSNKPKIIIDACGGSGAWSKPYKDAGYDVRLVTLPDNDVRTYQLPDEPIYGILAAPPCTEFSLAKSTKSRDFGEGMEVVAACLELIWQARKRGKLRFWALENPRGFLRQFLGKPPFCFEHWEFGDKGIKPTDLWGYFNPPIRKIKSRPQNLSRIYPNGRHNAIGWSKSADKRALTPAGFALAFFAKNR